MKLKILLIFLIFHGICYSQNLGSVSGRVIDNETGYALEGATIIIDETSYSTITNQSGFFQIKDIPTSSYNITASFIGFKSLTKFNVIVKSAGNQSIEYLLNPSSPNNTPTNTKNTAGTTQKYRSNGGRNEK